ncbi:Phosphoenolpyruvate-protein phosphotransferase of PTS system, partial [hydrothermal vent metagenome]
METWHGIAVSPGVIIGPALVLGTEVFRIPQRFVSIDAVETEISRFRAAMEQVYEEIAKNEELASDQLGAQYGAIFAAHLQMVRDPRLIGEIEELVQEKNYSPEFATSRVLRKYAKVFQNLGDNYMAERAADIFDLEKRILRNLLGERREELATLTESVIVLANNLTPSETANLNKEFVQGFATERGGRTSHTAILAGALEIPAVVGLGNFLSEISGGETIIIDGNRGKVILNPDEKSLEEYHKSKERQRTVTERRLSLGSILPITTDGTRIQVMGNIEFPDEAEHCTRRGADGIGLYRTEFLYLERNLQPTEEDHYQAYCQVIRAFPNQPVIIRTIDLGADKVPGSMEQIFREMPNPVLGLRSIRLCLKNQPLFKTQLRAILRAAVNGDVKIMFPLVATLGELRQAKMILKDVQEEL